jgi:hypothetical protein
VRSVESQKLAAQLRCNFRRASSLKPDMEGNAFYKQKNWFGRKQANTLPVKNVLKWFK